MTLIERLVMGLAGLSGAAGVGLAAIGAHVAGGANLATASYFLMLHAAAAMGLVALAGRAGFASRLLMGAAGLMLVGGALFCGDLAMRDLAGMKLLWGTAPFGGTLMIAAWLAAGAAGFVSLRR